MSTSLLNTWRSVNCQKKEDALAIAQTNKQTTKKYPIIWNIHRYSHLTRQTNINLQKSENRKKRVGRKREDRDKISGVNRTVLHRIIYMGFLHMGFLLITYNGWGHNPKNAQRSNSNPCPHQIHHLN